MPYESRCRPTSPPTTAAPQFSVPVDVASHTGAMQAQEHRIQRWAVATRTRNPSQEALMSCFSQRITRIRRISLFTFILHSSFFIWRSAPSFFTSEDKNSSNSCNPGAPEIPKRNEELDLVCRYSPELSVYHCFSFALYAFYGRR